jgi:hypothetical protein
MNSYGGKNENQGTTKWWKAKRKIT